MSSGQAGQIGMTNKSITVIPLSGGEPDQPNEGGHAAGELGGLLPPRLPRPQPQRGEGERAEAEERQDLVLLREPQIQRVLPSW